MIYFLCTLKSLVFGVKMGMTIKKILIRICCLCIIPLVILQIVTSFIYQNRLEKQIEQASQQNLSQIANQMQNMITSLVATSNILCYDQDIIDVLASGAPETTIERFEKYKTVQDKISTVSSSTLVPYNADIFVIGEDEEVYCINQVQAISSAIYKVYEQEKEALEEVGAYILWIAPVDSANKSEIDFTNSIAIAKTVNQSVTNDVLGVVVINLHLDKNLQKVFSTDIAGTGTEVLLLNQNDELVYSTQNTPTIFSDEAMNQMDGKSGSFTTNISGEKHMVDYQVLSRTNWKLVQISPYSALMSDIIALRNGILLVNIILLTLLIIADVVVSNRLADPLHELCVLMGQVQKGDFSVRMKERTGQSEISQISQSFNEMVGQTEELFCQLEHSYKVREDLRLAALRAQVNPHFLFNTLNSIKWMAMMNGDAKVGKMISSLGHLLQFTLASNSELVSVEREVACLKDYVEIQRMRFGEKFELVIEIPDELMSFQIPLFIFQPIVENSILHAFDDDCEAGVITIGADKTEESVQFFVSDNGKGMDISQIRNPIDDEVRAKGKFSRVGLKNVDERIKIIYGEEYGISIESVIGEGSTVYLSFPAIPREE